MRDYINRLKEKDQKMEDSQLQKHLNMDEELNIKNKEQISIIRKERKKKELEDQFEKQRNEYIVQMHKLLKKNYKDVTIKFNIDDIIHEAKAIEFME